MCIRVIAFRIGLVAGSGAVGLLIPPELASARTAGARGAASADAAARAGRWALAIALGFLVIGIPIIGTVIGWVTSTLRRTGRPVEPWSGRSLLIGQDNRASTSKTTAVIWTFSVAAALLSFLIAEWLGYPHALTILKTQGLNAQYALLLGGPLGAAIAAKGIVSAQVAKGAVAKPVATTAPTPGQLVQNDAGRADLGDVQYMLFNLVALIFFYGELLRVPQLGMPTIPDVLLGLTSVSAVGFVSKKALYGPAGITDVTPKSAHVGDPVTITTAGLIQAPDDLPAVTVTFGDVAAGPLTVNTTTSFGALITAKVPFKAAGVVDVKVSVPNSPAAVFPGFKIIPAIAREEHLVGRHGDPVQMMTTGITGLGASLSNLNARIGDEPAQAALNPSGELELTVPPTVAPGPHEVTLATPGGAGHAFITILESSPVVSSSSEAPKRGSENNGGS